MRYRVQWRIRRGPVRINVSRSGASATVYPLWPLTRRVSWNSRTGRVTVDNPGPGSFVTERPVRLRTALAGLLLMAAVAAAAVVTGWVLWGPEISTALTRAVAAASAAVDPAGRAGR